MSHKQNDIWDENLAELRLEKAMANFRKAMDHAMREAERAEKIFMDLRSSSSEEKAVTGSDPSGLTGRANLQKGENK